MKKLLLFSIIAFTLVFAGCLQQPNVGNSNGTTQQKVSEAGLIGNITGFALTANDTGFDVSDYSDLSPGENGTQLTAAGFDTGFSVGLAKYDEQNFERIVHQVTRYKSREGALKAFNETWKVIMEGNDVTAQLNLPKLADTQFGVKGSRTVNLGVKTATIDDYIIVFVKSNVLVAVDYFGLTESTSEQKALQFAQIAASKVG